MDGLGRAVGSPAHITLDGKLYAVRVDLAALGEIEQHLLSEQPDVIAMASRFEGSIQPAAFLDVMDEAVLLAGDNNVVGTDDLINFCRSFDGASLLIWISLRQSGVELQWIRDQLARLAEVEFEIIVNRLFQSGGYDQLGVLDWAEEDEDNGSKDENQDAGVERNRQRINWRRLQRDAWEAFGVMPYEFGKLTIYQIRTMTRDRKELDGKISVSVHTFMAMSPEERADLIQRAKHRRRKKWQKR